jgi:DNA-binding NarL/FixJ family response regulator
VLADSGKRPEAGPIRVLVVEDDRSARESLRILIDGTSGMRCLGAFAAVEPALRTSLPTAPDVILLDIELPGMSGAEGVRPFRQKFPPASVVMLTVYEEQDKIFESICNGACGYLLKKTAPARILEAIREVHKGGAPMSPEIARRVVGLFQRRGPAGEIEQDLAPQEKVLLSFLAEGHSYQAAADRMGISVNTVRNYIRSIYEKLHVHSKSEAVLKAFRSGLL